MDLSMNQIVALIEGFWVVIDYLISGPTICRAGYQR